MVDVKPILNAGLAAQSAALASDSFSLLRKKKKRASDFLGTGVRSMVGTSLLKSQAELIGGM
jgi:hypothetical protein